MSREEAFAQACQATLRIAQATQIEEVLRAAAVAVQELTGARQGVAVLFSVDESFSTGERETAVVETSGASLASRDQLVSYLQSAVRAERVQTVSVNGEENTLMAMPGSLDKGEAFGLGIVEDAGFSQQQRRVIEMVGQHTAVALQKATTLKMQRAHSRQLEERNRQMDAFSEAVRNVAGELALDKVLQQIVDSARILIQAEYAALGVPTSDGEMETFVHSGMAPDVARNIPHLPEGRGLLGAIIRDKRPIRIPAIADDPRSVGFPPNHPPMSSFLGVPIVAAGETLGNLYLTNKIGAVEFTADDQKLAEMLGAHAAVAIQNARLYEQVERLVIVEERNRIGMDLHDGIIQSIYAVGLTLESTRLSLSEGAQEEADQLLGAAIEALNDTIRDIRNFILDLRPHRFSGNLKDGLIRLVREFQANTMVEVAFNAELDDLTDLRTPLARAIFLTTQEGLANVARHARADHVTINVRHSDEWVQLTVRDDGRGFDPSDRSSTVGHGLSNMRARAEELGGSFQLESTPGEGTTLSLSFPMKR